MAHGIFPHPGSNADPLIGRQIFNHGTSGEVLGYLFSCASCAFSLFNIFALSSSFVINQLSQIFLFLSLLVILSQKKSLMMDGWQKISTCNMPLPRKWKIQFFSLSYSGSNGKASVYNAGDPGSSPGLGRSPGEGNGSPLQYSCLENPMDCRAW